MTIFPAVLTAILLLSACRSPASPTPQAIQPSATPHERLAASPTPVRTAAPTLATSPTLPPVRATQAIQAPALDVAETLCSPLLEHPLAELPEIVSDPYNPPPPGKEQRHHGVDFSYYRRGERLSIEGAAVQTVFPGVVAASIQDRLPYGNMVIIETPQADLAPGLAEQLGLAGGESIYTLYAHMGAPPIVTLGERVAACQGLGPVGKSGNAGIPHLHLEMRRGSAGQGFGGMAFYSTQTTQEERDNYLLWRTSGEFQHFDPMLVLIPQSR